MREERVWSLAAIHHVPHRDNDQIVSTCHQSSHTCLVVSFSPLCLSLSTAPPLHLLLLFRIFGQLLCFVSPFTHTPHPTLTPSPTFSRMLFLPSFLLSSLLNFFSLFFLPPPPYPQMEHPWPAGGIAEPFCGTSVPAQHDRWQPASHGPSGQSSEPASGAPGPTACHIQTQPAPAQRYDHNIISHTATLGSSCKIHS